MRTVGSLCTGYGGLELALGLPALWHAEIAAGPSEVLAARFPEVPNLGDIAEVNWSRRGPGTRPNVLAAGFPCQPASSAGRRQGRADARWLWPEVARATRYLEPSEIVIENVPNLLRVDDGEAWRDVIGDLADLGYAVRWTILGACATGLAHHRHRLFARALPASGNRRPTPRRWPAAGALIGGEVIDLPAPTCGGKHPLCLPTPTADERRGRHTSPEVAAGRMAAGRRNLDDAMALLPTPTARDGDGRGEGSPEYWRRRIEETGRSEGMPLGAALRLLPTPRASAARTSRRAIVAPNSRSAPSLEQAVEIATGQLPRELNGWSEAPSSWGPSALRLLPTPRATDGPNGGPNQRGARGDLALPSAVQMEHFGAYAEAVARHVGTTGILPPPPTEPNRNGQPRLSAAFAEWLMDLPPGWVTGILDRNPALTAIGNGVVPRQAAAAYRLLCEPL